MKFTCIALLALCAITVSAHELRQNEHVHLKTCHHRHISTPDERTITQNEEPGQHETFQVHFRDGKFGLVAFHRHFLSARDNGSVDLMPWMREWEMYSVEEHHRGSRVKLRTWRNTFIHAPRADVINQASADMFTQMFEGKRECEWFEVIKAKPEFFFELFRFENQ